MSRHYAAQLGDQSTVGAAGFIHPAVGRAWPAPLSAWTPWTWWCGFLTTEPQRPTWSGPEASLHRPHYLLSRVYVALDVEMAGQKMA
jgi:hypothetical protein